MYLSLSHYPKAHGLATQYAASKRECTTSRSEDIRSFDPQGLYACMKIVVFIQNNSSKFPGCPPFSPDFVLGVV